MDGPDDGTLATRAKSGDREAFGELVTRHERPMLTIARAYFASEADAQDAVQDAFVRAYRSLGQLAAPASFPAWLARITVNTCLNTLAARTDKVSLADFATTAQFHSRVGSVQLTPATLASQGEESRILKAALGRLPEDQRVPLMLRYVEDMTYEQIAAYLGVLPSTVRGRLQSAKRALRRQLEALNPGRG